MRRIRGPSLCGQKNCLLGALHWQVTGSLLTAVPRSVRGTPVSSQTVGAPERVQILCDAAKKSDLHILDPGDAAES